MKNLTPHAIRVRHADGSETVFEPSGVIARVTSEEKVVTDYDGIPVIVRSTGEVYGLPDDGTPCLVSSMVLAALPGREHTYAPDTGSTAVRDDKGHIVAVTRLVAA